MKYNIRPVNWNAIEDEFDLKVWNKVTSNFWLDTKIPLSNDIKSWSNMTEEERLVTRQVFSGLTLLDTIQNLGVAELIKDSQTPHEEVVLSNFAFMEGIHAKSYSSIFSTLCSSEEIEDSFRWAEENEFLQYKSTTMSNHYNMVDPLKRKIASVLLESFLFYSGFYWPLYLSSKAKLTNTNDIIKLIVRDESIHGLYIGYKFQKAIPEGKKQEYLDFTLDLLMDLFENEVKYTRDIYDPVGRSEDVIKFLKYNANKAMQNLGFDPLFSSDQTDASAAVISALGAVDNHDFFSGSGSTYVIGKHEESEDEDWDF